MLGRTHFFVGVSAALAIVQPQTMSSLVVGMGAAAVGSVISDVDAGTSQAHREANKVITVSFTAVAAMILAEYYLHLGIYQRLLQNSSILRMLSGAAAFLLICTYGKGQPHRSFLHSFAAMILLTACVDVIYPDASAYFAVAFLSHLALDFLNYKPEKLLWPWKKGFSLGVCTAKGLVNHLLLLLGTAALVIELILSVPAARLLHRIIAIFS